MPVQIHEKIAEATFLKTHAKGRVVVVANASVNGETTGAQQRLRR